MTPGNVVGAGAILLSLVALSVALSVRRFLSRAITTVETAVQTVTDIAASVTHAADAARVAIADLADQSQRLGALAQQVKDLQTAAAQDTTLIEQIITDSNATADALTAAHTALLATAPATLTAPVSSQPAIAPTP